MQISDSEKLLMDVLWISSPKSAKEIIASLDSEIQWHEKTVLNSSLKCLSNVCFGLIQSFKKINAY